MANLLTPAQCRARFPFKISEREIRKRLRASGLAVEHRRGWQPMKPRGEVYSRDWTPADWKSWSDLHGAKDGDGAFGAVIVEETT